jgi:hypothetical protein
LFILSENLDPNNKDHLWYYANAKYIIGEFKKYLNEEITNKNIFYHNLRRFFTITYVFFKNKNEDLANLFSEILKYYTGKK